MISQQGKTIKKNNNCIISKGVHFAIGFNNPERGFPAGPFPTLKEALEEGGKVDLFGEDCYLYRISGSSARRIRKWNFIEDKWEFIK